MIHNGPTVHPNPCFSSVQLCITDLYFILYMMFYTLSGRIGKVVALHAGVARSTLAEVALIYTMHERSGGTAHEGGGATSKLDLPSLTPLSVVGCG